MNQVSIPLADYLVLVADSQLLAALRTAGVDRWEGYAEASRKAQEAKKARLDE